MKVIVYKKVNEEPVEIGRVSVDEKECRNSLFYTLQKALEEVPEFYGKKISDMGISSVYGYKNCQSTFKGEGECGEVSSRNSVMIGAEKVEKPEKWQRPVTIRNEAGVNEDTGIYIGFRIYREGYVINCGKEGSNILGAKSQMYFDKITPRKFMASSISNCKTFAGYGEILKTLVAKEHIFHQMVAKYGYKFTLEMSNPFFEEEENERFKSLSDKKREKFFDTRDAVMKLFDRINKDEDLEQAPEILPEKATEENMKAEAVRRMNELDLWNNIIRRFKQSGTIYQSEAGGIIYSLSDDVKKAVEKAKEFGLPYHVVVSDTQIGRLCSVLYVSRHPSEWPMERFDKKTGIIFSDVYNASDGLDELGDIRVLPANGGLVREA